ncbi:MAG TPA: TetR/AcrR family transcriptional regulator [Terriglobales bacterium]|jgi:AcrR family transcriptional regulator
MTKDRIFAAAQSVLEREGIAGLSVRKVAQRAGVSPMAMYNHFADKDTLLNALMEDGLTAWERIVRAIRAPDPMRWLERLMEAFLDFALTQPHRFDAAFFSPASKARHYPDDFVAGRSPVIAMVMVRIDQAKANGALDDKPALDMALAVAALGQGLVSMHRAGRFSSEKQFKVLYRTAMRHCLDSFKPAGRNQ